jgi:hypothetical protein
MKKIAYLLLALIALLVVLYLTGCSTAYKTARDIKKLDVGFIAQPAEAARLSNWLFPCFTGKAKSDTLYKRDTVNLPGDTSKKITVRHDTVYSETVIKLPGKIIDNSETIHDTIPDHRALSDVMLQLATSNQRADKAEQQLADTQKSENVWRWIAIGLMAVVFGTVIWKIYKLFNGGAVESAVTEIKKI